MSALASHSRLPMDLGPDPEPYGVRFDRLSAAEDRRRVMSAPPVCPLDRALGRRRPCTRGGCLYWQVPEVATECAIEQWAPSVSRQPRLAAWFTRWGGEQ